MMFFQRCLIAAFTLVMVLPDRPMIGQEAGKPNLIIINIDDLGYADIGPYGSKLNRTPNLDRMAREGRKLTSFYAAPVCSPSRSALMTGCYAKRVLPIQHVLFPIGENGLHPETVTVAEVLKEQGYATGIVGKWHLGDQPEFFPTRQGFDFWFGLPYSNDMGPAADGVKSDFGKPIPEPKKNTGKQPPLPLMRNETVVQRVLAKDQETLVSRYTEEAVEFIRQRRASPFFLYVAHNSVHFPLYPSEAFRGKSGNGLYGDWVEETDWSVGEIFKALRDLQLDTKTLVVFTSDNGGTNRGFNTPLRGNKGSTWEGGVRVPTIAWWPGKIPAGTETDAITAMFDILPTFARLGGASPERLANLKLDGKDLWPLLSGQTVNPPLHDSFLYYRGLDLEAVRVGHWKLHLKDQALYDLAKDIGEANNVAAAHPDIVKQLRGFAEATSSDLAMTGLGPGTRQLGKLANPQPIIDHDGSIRPELRSPSSR